MRCLRCLVAAIVLCGTLSLASCTSTATSGEPRSTSLDLRDGQRGSSATASFDYGAFAVTIGYAVYDESAQALFVGTRWENLSDGYATAPPSFQLVRLRTPDGHESPGDVMGFDQSAVPPGTSAEVTFVWRYLAADPLDEGELVIGALGARATTVALDGGHGENQLATREIAVDRWLEFGPHTVHLHSAMLGPGHLSDNTQADAAHRVLRLGFDVWISTPSRVGWLPDQSLALRLPDGGIVRPRLVPSVREMTWSAIEGSWAEFEVPDDAAGDYELLLFRRVPGVLGTPVVGNSVAGIPFTVDEAREAPRSIEALPRTALEPRAGSARAAEPAPDREIDVDAAPVNAAGWALTVTGGTLSPTNGRLVLAVEARHLGAASEDGVFAVPPSLVLPTALEFGARMTGAMLIINGTATERTAKASLEFWEVPADLDLTTAVLHLGNNARIAFEGGSAPVIPERLRAEAETATAGEFTVAVHDYRVGYLTGTDLAPGLVELEVGYDLTSSSGASDQTTFFNPTSQMFLSRRDGYVTVASPMDLTGIQHLEVGMARRMTTTFVVPRQSLESGIVYLRVRSRDEMDFPRPKGWLETTIPVTLTGQAARS